MKEAQSDSESTGTESTWEADSGQNEEDSDTTIGFEGEDIFIVEKILDHRVRNGQDQWLVKWVDHAETENSWEPIECFVASGARKMVVDFEEKRKMENLQSSSAGASSKSAPSSALLTVEKNVQCSNAAARSKLDPSSALITIELPSYDAWKERVSEMDQQIAMLNQMQGKIGAKVKWLEEQSAKKAMKKAMQDQGKGN